MNYQTRHLQALVEIPMGDVYYVAGDRFWATHVDADYLVAKRKATELPATQSVALTTAPAPAPAVAPAPPPVEAPPNVDIEPRAWGFDLTGAGDRVAGVVVSTSDDDQPAAAPAPEQASAPAPRRARTATAAKSSS